VIFLRVVIFSWEFPPRAVGELAFYVDKLASNLARKGVDVYVVTFYDGRTGIEERLDGVKIYRVTNPIKSHISIVTWDLSLMVEFMRAFSEIYYSVNGKIDLIDSQEWLCVSAATALKNAFNIPFLYTLHSLEDHRSFYSDEQLNISIKHLERLGSFEADRVLVVSDWMKNELDRLYGVPNDKIDVVPSNSQQWITDVVNSYKMTIKLSKGGSKIG
jgi:glycosyltransferase involved in cell wall biosynthesis